MCVASDAKPSLVAYRAQMYRDREERAQNIENSLLALLVGETKSS